VIEDHLKKIGLIVSDDMSPEQKKLIAEKRAAYESRSKKKPDVSARTPAAPAQTLGGNAISPDLADRAKPAAAATSAESFPPGATLCPKCSAKAMVLMDGCATCLSCGYSKCG
jgi:hypothetical protein